LAAKAESALFSKPVVANRTGVLTTAWLQDRLVRTIGLSPEQPLMLAYSGGVDSETLLHLLANLQRLGGWTLRAVHVNHGISSKAEAWMAHCAARCEALGVPFATERVRLTTQKGEGREAAARRARYRALQEHIEPNGVLLTAQHQRDQAETLLLRLLRGAGCQGLAAMRPRQPFGLGYLVRPFLDVPREAIEAYAAEQDLCWVEDEMNADLTLARGFLRAKVMPSLRQFWPGADAQISRVALNAADASTLLDEVADQDLAMCRVDDTGILSVAGLKVLSELRRKNALRRWFVQMDREPPSVRHLGQILRIIEKRSSTAKATTREGKNEVCRYRDRLSLAAVHDRSGLRQWRANWNPAQPLILPADAGILRAVQDRGFGLSVQRLGGNLLHVRFRQGGETCRLPGRLHRHRVKKMLQEAGIPPWARETMPMIYVGESLAAIGEDWVCAPFAAEDGEPSLRLVIDRQQD